jgi:hypothetical protein
MLKLGTVGLAAVKNRVQSGLNANDQAAKPLTKGYAIRKSKALGKRAKRDLTFTGGLLRNLQVRTVSAKTAQARPSTRRDRIKGLANARVEPWLVFSKRNERDVLNAFQRIFAENVRHLVR